MRIAIDPESKTIEFEESIKMRELIDILTVHFKGNDWEEYELMPTIYETEVSAPHPFNYYSSISIN
jgi:hypothetical protein